MKKGLRGFTLIELMVVIAIIGVLATVITAPIQTYLKKSRDAKKIADIAQIKNALASWATDHNGTYPATLAALAPQYLPVVPRNTLATTRNQDKYMYVVYRDINVPANIISYHLGVALEFQNPAIQGVDADCTGTSQAAALPAGTCALAAAGAPADFTNGSAAGGAGFFGANGNAQGVATAVPAIAVQAALALGAGSLDFRGVDDGSDVAAAPACAWTAASSNSNCIYDIVP